MQTASEIIQQSQNSQTRPREITYANTHEHFVSVWRGLQAAKLLTKDEVVGGTEFKYWRHMLRELTDKQLSAGMKAIENFEGYLTLGAFKNLCVESARVIPAHKPFSRNLLLKAKKLEAAEMRGRIKKMREELGL